MQEDAIVAKSNSPGYLQKASGFPYRNLSTPKRRRKPYEGLRVRHCKSKKGFTPPFQAISPEPGIYIEVHIERSFLKPRLGSALCERRTPF